MWQNVAGSMEPIIPNPSPAQQRTEGRLFDSRLWYDVRDVPFLREDATEAAAIESTRATTIKTYVDAGFTPESAIAAVDSQDVRLLVHTGLVSVQLLPADGSKPGGDAPADGADPVVPPDEAKARAIADLLPKLASGTDKVIDPKEARNVLNLVGAGLSGDYAPPEPPAPAPAAPAAAADGANSAAPAPARSSAPQIIVPAPNVTVTFGGDGDGERFNKLHGKGGKFAPKLGAPAEPAGLLPGGLVSTGGRGANHGPKGKAAVAAAMKKHGLTHEGIRAEIRGRVKGNSEGKGWYSDARKFHEGLAAKHGVSIERVTAVTAAISPRCQWLENKRLTARLLEIHKDHPDLSDVELAKVMGGQALPVNKQMAVRLLRGSDNDIETELTGLKRRSFYNNMLKPGETDDVTIDVWATMAARNSSTTGMTKEASEAFIYASKVATDGGVGYSILADAYRDVAAELDLSPDDVQAIYWTSVTGSVDGKYGS
jgi:hypothetical protein